MLFALMGNYSKKYGDYGKILINKKLAFLLLLPRRKTIEKKVYANSISIKIQIANYLTLLFNIIFTIVTILKNDEDILALYVAISVFYLFVAILAGSYAQGLFVPPKKPPADKEK
jgi:hypothetical protein